jgi:hypothetical protein
MLDPDDFKPTPAERRLLLFAATAISITLWAACRLGLFH